MAIATLLPRPYPRPARATDAAAPAERNPAPMRKPPVARPSTRLGFRPSLRAAAILATGLFLSPMATAAAQATCAGGSSQSALNGCAGRALEAADQSLNDTYKALIDRVSPQGRHALQTAQRAWIAYRDGQCAFETAGSAESSIHPMMLAACLSDLTVMQTRRLEAQLLCEEGDLSCGGQ